MQERVTACAGGGPCVQEGSAACAGGGGCVCRRGRALPECQPLLHLAQEAPVELVDGVDVGEEQRHQVGRHGVLLDHGAAEPLREERSAGA